MKRLENALGVGGGIAFVLAVLFVVAPEAIGVNADELVEIAGNDYLLVVPIGLLAVAVVLAVLGSRMRSGVDQARPPAPEGVPTGPAPGTKFDRLATGRLGALTRLSPGRAEAIRESLGETAVRTVMRVDGCTRTEARQRVENGRWTDDPAARAFLAPDEGRTGLVGLFRETLRFRQRIRRTATAIEEYDERRTSAVGAQFTGTRPDGHTVVDSDPDAPETEDDGRGAPETEDDGRDEFPAEVADVDA